MALRDTDFLGDPCSELVILQWGPRGVVSKCDESMRARPASAFLFAPAGLVVRAVGEHCLRRRRRLFITSPLVAHARSSCIEDEDEDDDWIVI